MPDRARTTCEVGDASSAGQPQSERGSTRAAKAPAADHQPERPVRDRECWVCSRPGRTAPPVGLDVVDALDLAVERVGGEERRQAGDPDREDLLGAVEAADGEQAEARRCSSVSQSASAAAIFIGCCSVMTCAWKCPVTATNRRQRPMTVMAPTFSDGRMTATRARWRTRYQAEMPSMNAPAVTKAASDRVREGHERCLSGKSTAKMSVSSARPVVGVEPLVADRVLHPRVRGEDEVRRDVGADRGQPDGGQVHPLGQAVPAEDPQPEERGLQEEGDQPLHRQRRTEDVADVTASTRSSSCRTGTPARCRSPRPWRS